MMKFYKRIWILCLLIVAALMGLHFLPPVRVAGITMRQVDILSDLFPDMPEVTGEELAGVLGMQQNGSNPADCPDGVTCIEDFAGGRDVSLDRFYRLLHEQQFRKCPVRIAYFGDSFIEGDIFTADLRDLLQSRFGGSGVGFVDMASQTAGFRRSVRAYAQHIQACSLLDSLCVRSRVGVNSRYFLPEAGPVSLLLQGTAYGKHTGEAQQARLFLKTECPLQIQASVNGSAPQTFRLSGSSRLQCLTVTEPMSRIRWSFTADSLLHRQVVLYGATMDDTCGVSVDNFSMRGSSGSTLLSIPETHLSQFFACRPYDLIVLHFGLNVVGAESGRKDAAQYGRTLDRMIARFRHLQPETPVLIVSVSDRDVKNREGKITTMDAIHYLVYEQKQAAVRNRVAFWNLFEAMGGTASIKRMAGTNPPQANKDYTHLTFLGGRVLAEKLYEAIVHGVKNYAKYEAHEKK